MRGLCAQLLVRVQQCFRAEAPAAQGKWVAAAVPAHPAIERQSLMSHPIPHVQSSEFDSTPNTLVGTPAYVAPEVIAARAHSVGLRQRAACGWGVRWGRRWMWTWNKRGLYVNNTLRHGGG